MMRQFVKKVGLGLVLTCGVPGLVLAQTPNVDTSKLEKAKTDAEQTTKAAGEGAKTAKEGTGDVKDAAAATKKGDVSGVQDAASKGHQKAKKAKTSGTQSGEKAKDTAKDITGK
jgi:hypothetical protein